MVGCVCFPEVNFILKVHRWIYVRCHLFCPSLPPTNVIDSGFSITEAFVLIFRDAQIYLFFIANTNFNKLVADFKYHYLLVALLYELLSLK